LLGRIVWFRHPGKLENPSSNHAWHLWRCDHRGPPIIRYAARSEAKTMVAAMSRKLAIAVGISPRSAPP
jgi:hypothetical protein